jgi:phage gp29-like protein
VFTPHRSAALQIKNGLGWILCWAYQIKSAVLADELLFVQTFGHPLVTGKYPRGASPEDIGLLSRAVSALNSTFRGVFRDDLKVEFQEIARSNTDIYEKVSRYIDELIAKVIWANTLSSEVGKSGSQALGKVHAEAKYDVIRSYANQWAACLQEFFDAYIDWNYGPNAPRVEIVVDVEGAEDFLTKSMVVKNLFDAGVPLVATEVREAFGYSEPQPGDELIGIGKSPMPDPLAPAPAPQPPAKAPTAPAAAPNALRADQGCPVHSAHAQGAPVPRDAIDDLADAMLADWVSVSAGIDEVLTKAAANTGSLEEMRSAMMAAVQSMDTTDLDALLTKARTATRLAGDLGADL